MKTSNRKLALSVLALAMQGVFAAMAAMPVMADDEVTAADQINPTNSIEIGVAGTSKKSAKFGEYNGLNDNGATAIGNINIGGGDGYGQNLGTYRWSIIGTDLGTDSREINATVGNQGTWKLSIDYDALTHNTSDTYQTPYQGSLGGNSFTLPGTFLTINTRTGIAASQLHNMDISNTRENTGLKSGFFFNPNLQLTFDYNHLDQSGAKLMAFGSALAGGANNEKVSILPNPTESTTDTFSLALNWTGDKGYATGSYYGSFFRNKYNQVAFETFWGANTMQSMSTAPDNDFHQLNLTGGYEISPQTKFAGGLSYSRNTQNNLYQTFGVDSALLASGYPKQTSLDGLVENAHLDGKLTNQTTKDLTLTAGVKYDERKNKTAATIYGFNAIDMSASHWAYYSNTPLSNRKTQFELAGDYRLGHGKNLNVDYTHEDIKRWCESYAGNYSFNANGTTMGTGANGNCVTATSSKEDKLAATYKFNLTDDATARLGYSYSKRNTDFDPAAIAAFLSNKTTTTVDGTNGGDFLGFNPWFEASRTEQLVKASTNWQATDKLSFDASARYTDDNYDPTYGLQTGNSWSLNLDATYAYAEHGALSAYVTQQHRQRDMTSMQSLTATTATATKISAPANATWSNTLKDDEFTLGLGMKQGGLLGGKVDVAGDLSYTLAKTNYNTVLNYSGTTTGGLTCSDPTLLTCGSTPDIKSEEIALKLTGSYKIDKARKVTMGYLYQHLKADDYYYYGYQLGQTPTSVMPTNQQSGSYNQNLVYVTYAYNFK